ncbi:MAG: (2Fe-2S)-binding protein [Deltaproteobacteria bacterium]|nr:(2Fe-2S)-binding protein [Deltaproteobacteria bacterium]
MIVCICRGVSDRSVRLAVMQGARSLPDVSAACGAGTGCGACHEMIEQMANEASSGNNASSSAGRCHNVASALPFPPR